MDSQQRSDADWKATLRPEAYAALRHGVMEPRGAGAYVTTHYAGLYRCAGCGAVLFHSDDKVHDGSGYATFRTPARDDAVLENAVYSDDGSMTKAAVCATCGGKVGVLDDVELQSDQDLTLGIAQRLYHISSNAVRFEKFVSVRNYPVASLVLLLVVLVGGAAGWYGYRTLSDAATLNHLDGAVPLWLGEQEVQAKVVHLNAVDPFKGTLLSPTEVLFVILAGVDGMPHIRFSNHPVDLLWLDDQFKVIGFEQARGADETAPLERPTTATYLLISLAGSLPSTMFHTGKEVLVTDRSALL
jgi:peptide-methionine (R)-S-oxide reductase